MLSLWPCPNGLVQHHLCQPSSRVSIFPYNDSLKYENTHYCSNESNMNNLLHVWSSHLDVRKNILDVKNIKQNPSEDKGFVSITIWLLLIACYSSFRYYDAILGLFGYYTNVVYIHTCIPILIQNKNKSILKCSNVEQPLIGFHSSSLFCMQFILYNFAHCYLLVSPVCMFTQRINEYTIKIIFSESQLGIIYMVHTQDSVHGTGFYHSLRKWLFQFYVDLLFSWVLWFIPELRIDEHC